jgi:hypothetical protein
MQKGRLRKPGTGGRLSVGSRGGQGSGFVGNEPGQQAAIEFLGSGGGGTAVFGAGDFPKLDFGIAGMDLAGVADGDVGVELAVDHQNRDMGRGYGVFGRDLIHVQVVFQAGAQERNFHQRTQDGSSEPGAQIEGLAHSVIGDLAKIGEGRLGGNGTEVWMCIERLQQLRGSHGLAEGKDATRVILHGQEIDPLMDVVTLKQSVGGERSTAQAVSAGIGKKHSKSVGEEELSISGHADAVIAHTVQEDHIVSDGLMGMDDPGAENGAVGSGDRCVAEFGVEGTSGLASAGNLVVGERAARGMECSVGYEDACDRADGQVQEGNDGEPANAAVGAHGLVDWYGGSAGTVPGIKPKAPLLAKDARSGAPRDNHEQAECVYRPRSLDSSSGGPVQVRGLVCRT